MPGPQEDHNKWLILNSMDGNQASALGRAGTGRRLAERSVNHQHSAAWEELPKLQPVSFQKYGEMKVQRSKVTCLTPHSLRAEPFELHCTHPPPIAACRKRGAVFHFWLRKSLVSQDFLGWSMRLVRLDPHSNGVTCQFECRTKKVWGNQAIP